MKRIPLMGQTLRKGKLELPPEAAHYVRQVLRLGPHAELELFDGNGNAARARITGLCRDDVMVTIDETWTVDVARPTITLYQAIPKGDRWELVIEKATELGVTEIVPVMTRRGVVEVPPAKADRKLERWTKIALAASRQSGRYHAPKIGDAIKFEKALARDHASLKLHADPRAEAGSLEDALDENHDSISLWVGPEGGFSDDELEAFAGGDWHAIHLANQVLRSETAGIFAVGLIRYLAGGDA